MDAPYAIPRRGVSVPRDKPAAGGQAAPRDDRAGATIAAAVEDVVAAVSDAGKPELVPQPAREHALEALAQADGAGNDLPDARTVERDFGVDLRPGAAAAHAYRARLGVDGHRAQQRQVGDGAVLDAAEAATVVGSAADREWQLVRAGEPDCPRDTGVARAAGDHGRAFVEHRVVEGACLVVAPVARSYQLPLEAARQLAAGGLGGFGGHAHVCPPDRLGGGGELIACGHERQQVGQEPAQFGLKVAVHEAPTGRERGSCACDRELALEDARAACAENLA